MPNRGIQEFVSCPSCGSADRLDYITTTRKYYPIVNVDSGGNCDLGQLKFEEVDHGYKGAGEIVCDLCGQMYTGKELADALYDTAQCAQVTKSCKLNGIFCKHLFIEQGDKEELYICTRFRHLDIGIDSLDQPICEHSDGIKWAYEME